MICSNKESKGGKAADLKLGTAGLRTAGQEGCSPAGLSKAVSWRRQLLFSERESSLHHEKLPWRLASHYFLHTRNTAASPPKVVPLYPNTSLSAFYTRTSKHCRACSALFRCSTTRELRARVQSGELLHCKHLVGAELKNIGL